jgi:hypothetical protein
MVDVKKYPRSVKLAVVRKLRSKIEKDLDIDLPITHELHHMLNMRPGKSRKVDRQLKEIDEALERKATREEMEEFEAQLDADMALANLEAEMTKLKKEEEEAEKVRQLEEEWEHQRRMAGLKMPSPEEVKVHEAALDEYAKKIGKYDEMVGRAEERQLSQSLRNLKKDIKSGKVSDEDREARIAEFVSAVRKTAHKRKKRRLKNLSDEQTLATSKETEQQAETARKAKEAEQKLERAERGQRPQ